MDSSVFKNGDRARPACRGTADLVGEAADREPRGRQRLQVVQLLKMAVADVAACLVALPDQGLVARLGHALGGVGKRRIPAPGVGAREAHTTLQQHTSELQSQSNLV